MHRAIRLKVKGESVPLRAHRHSRLAGRLLPPGNDRVFRRALRSFRFAAVLGLSALVVSPPLLLAYVVACRLQFDELGSPSRLASAELGPTFGPRNKVQTLFEEL